MKEIEGQKEEENFFCCQFRLLLLLLRLLLRLPTTFSALLVQIRTLCGLSSPPPPSSSSSSGDPAHKSFSRTDFRHIQKNIFVRGKVTYNTAQVHLTK